MQKAKLPRSEELAGRHTAQTRARTDIDPGKRDANSKRIREIDVNLSRRTTHDQQTRCGSLLGLQLGCRKSREKPIGTKNV